MNTEIRITENSDWQLFDDIASLMEKQGLVFTDKIDGEDQRYWDFEYENAKFTLHLEHYTGISIFPKSKSSLVTINNLIEEIMKQIAI